MFNFCSTYNIKLIHQWIPFEQNELTDHYNRINDNDNWVIHEGSLELVRNFYDPFWIDRFADNFNHNVKKFNSKYYCPGTPHANTFTGNWIGEEN